MVVLISVAFLILGVWLWHLNRTYANINPIYQSWFICLLAAFLLFCGTWSQGFHTPLPAPLAIVFPIYLLMLFGFIIYDTPSYTYKEACDLIADETGQTILHPPHEKLSEEELYYCYMEKGCYVFDPYTGDYSAFWDTSII